MCSRSAACRSASAGSSFSPASLRPSGWRSAGSPSRYRNAKGRGVKSSAKNSFVCLAASLALGACDLGVAQGPESKLAAKVNGAEITVRQVKSSSAERQGNPSQALEKIIDRELLVQKALAAGLERDP